MQFIRYHENWSLFQIYDFITLDAMIASAVLTAKSIKTPIKYLNSDFESVILAHFKDRLCSLQKKQRKFFITYDISNFPFILARIDFTAHITPDDPEDRLSTALAQLWNEYDTRRIVILAINSHCPSVNIKCIYI